MNAQKYTIKGKVTVRVYTVKNFTPSVELNSPRREGSPRSQGSPTKDTVLRISVEDTGIGIPQEKLSVIFNMFEQVDNSLTRKSSGTGLGLNICRQIVGLMGGQIWCESEPDRGSKFTFEIPVFVSVDQNESEQIPCSPAELKKPSTFLSPPPSPFSLAEVVPPASPSEEKRSPLVGWLYDHPLPSAFHPFRVLIVEDNLLNQKVVANMLRQFEVTMEVANNGKAALDRVKRQDLAKFNMVLMDVCMPEMDGLTATQEIREYERLHDLPPLPIIALSALVLAQDRDACQKAGMNGFLEKPVKLRSLENVMKPIMKQYILKASEKVQ